MLNNSHVLQVNSLFKRAFKYGYVKCVIKLEQLISLKSLKVWLRYGEFSIFQNGGRHVGFLKLQISNCGTYRKCRIASPCQISWRLVKPLSRYLDFFQDGDSHHFGFLKF